MGCNCKTVKKINERINANNKQYEKRGTLRILRNIWLNFIHVLNIFLTCIIIITLVPIIILILLYNFLFKQDAYVPLPSKFIKNKNDELSNEDVLINEE